MKGGLGHAIRVDRPFGAGYAVKPLMWEDDAISEMNAEAPVVCGGDRGSRVEWAVVGAVMALFAVVLVRTAWVSDDAYITLRTVDNFVHGYGLRWNPAERVQSYTHPLWMFVLSAAYFVTREAYLTTIAVCIATSLAAVSVFAFAHARRPRQAVFGVTILLCSAAFVDYATSGLENPLTYLCFALFLREYFRGDDWTPKRLLVLSLWAGLAVTNRMDTLLLCAPALGYAWHRNRGVKGLVAVAAGFLPFVLWEGVSLVYYGFLFPNTAYAKLMCLGIDRTDLIAQGLRYMRDSLTRDPITIIAIVAAVLTAPVMGRRRGVPVAAGIALYAVYVLWIGGDFMSGRFFSAPVFCAVMLMGAYVETAPRRLAYVGAVCMAVAVAFLVDRPPFLSGSDYGYKDPLDSFGPGGISDERGCYFTASGLFRENRTGAFGPQHGFVRIGKRFHDEAPTTRIIGPRAWWGITRDPKSTLPTSTRCATRCWRGCRPATTPNGGWDISRGLSRKGTSKRSPPAKTGSRTRTLPPTTMRFRSSPVVPCLAGRGGKPFGRLTPAGTTIASTRTATSTPAWFVAR